MCTMAPKVASKILDASGTYLDSWHFLLGSDVLQRKQLNHLSKIIKIAGYIIMFLAFSFTKDIIHLPFILENKLADTALNDS